MSKPILDPRTGLYRIRPYYEGKRLLISLGTRDEAEAGIAAGEVAKRIWAIEHGLAEIPSDADPVDFIRTGTVRSKTTTNTLAQLIDAYREATPEGVKAKTTRVMEEIHFRHLLKGLGEGVTLAQMTHERIQRYVSSRLKQSYRGRRVTGPTIKKELTTLKMLWGFGVRLKWLNTVCPTDGIKLPKERTKEPFLTLGQIEAEVQRLPKAEQRDLWSRCVLIGEEISEILKHVRDIKDPVCLYPMVVTAFYTGMRRSELCRSRVGDWDLEAGTVRVRERKRKHDKSDSYRYVDLSSDLIEVIREYEKRHRGGSFMFCDEKNVRISPKRADNLWKIAVKDSRFASVKGWHCARHSFCSNLASLGVGPALISSYMGHETEEQKARYTHFFPNDRKRAIDRLSFVKQS